MDRKINVYLAGCEGWYVKNSIGNNYYIEWRKEAEDWFEKYADNVNAINPCKYYDYMKNCHRSEEEVRRFDLHKVRKSEVVLVNLDHIKDSVGTMNEIFCAYEHGIPVIGFYEFSAGETSWADNRYKTEPWIIDTCHRIEDDETSALIDALTYIKDYYLT